jgi:heme/copper-type cytochrome/quinol oxidase subunit 1
MFNHMRRREVAYLLIGLGVGLIFAVAAIVWFAVWFHHMFIIGIKWNPASIVLTLPFLLVLTGSMLLYWSKSERKPN